MNKLKQWNLGGNLIVFGAVLPNGCHMVWYPDGVPGMPLEGFKDGAPVLVIFARDDEEYVNPIGAKYCANLEQAQAIIKEVSDE